VLQKLRSERADRLISSISLPCTLARRLLIVCSMGEQPDALRRRAADFAAAVLRFVRRLPADIAADSTIRQVARSAGNFSANYRAACTARSGDEFIAKLGLAVEEVHETGHWLWMAGQLGLGNTNELTRLATDARELGEMLSASLSAARVSLRRGMQERGLR
jgi:four helix bundle protein